ncbi:MAG TPA: pentapeptide repeat-containing protein, partial [Anseongella sp.]|nr:pentapeptide repeat-containing protein [Anseongella sp.]
MLLPDEYYTIGTYAGACVLEAPRPQDWEARYLSPYQWPYAPYLPAGWQLLQNLVSFGPFASQAPLLVAVYRLPDGRVQLQAAGRGQWIGIGAALENRTDVLNWQLSERPAALTLTSAGDDAFTVSYTDSNGIYDTLCSDQSWNPGPLSLMQRPHSFPVQRFRMTFWLLFLRESYPEYHVLYPSPEVIRKEPDLWYLLFHDFYLLGTDFRGGFLEQADFSQATLRGVLFDGARLAGAKFQGRGLEANRGQGYPPCSFTGANLRGAQLDNCRADGCPFSNADLTGARLAGASLRYADFRGAVLAGANLADTDLNGADLRGADLRGTNFSGADLRRVRIDETTQFGRAPENRTVFRGAIVPYSLLGKDWRYLDLSGTRFEGWPVQEGGAWDLEDLAAEGAVLRRLDLRGANLRGANLDRTVLQESNLAYANLSHASLEDAVLAGSNEADACSLAFATLTGADLSGADLSKANLSYTRLDGASLDRTMLVLTNLNGAYLTGADFSNVSGNALQGCSFEGACLVNSNFQGTRVGAYAGKATSFLGACLQGADFEDA